MLGSGFSLQAAFWYQKAMLALLPRGGESLTPRLSAGAREEGDFNFSFLIDAFALLRLFKPIFEWRSRYNSRYEIQNY